MTTCQEAAHYVKCRLENYASPEMVEAAKEHFATCVSCGGTMPGQEDLQAIFRDMFLRVGHQEVCKGKDCRCGDDPPSYFESQVVKQFRKPT
jgi:hypothetical protein